MRAAFLSLLLALASHPCLAGVTYQEARKLTDEMSRVVMATQAWHLKPLADRIAAYRKADALVADAERMFGASPIGDFASCRRAAISMKFYVIELNDMALIFEGRKQVSTPGHLFAPMFNSFNFGDAYRTCKDQIEVLDASKKAGK